jgi:UDP-glucuronate 4-epimerase
MSNILVTGCAGFIGSHFCERLLDEGHRVIGIDNFNSSYNDRYMKKSNPMKDHNVANFIKRDNFSLITGDIRSKVCLENIFYNHSFDLIIHLAARAGVRQSINNTKDFFDNNVTGTLNLLEFAKIYNIKKFIFASSSSVYGGNKQYPFCEDQNVDYPISPYAVTKKSGELMCYNYYNLYGINMTCLRFFTVYGPRQRPDLAIHKFTRLIDCHKKIPIYCDKKNPSLRDFTYISDIIDGIMLSIEKCNGYNIYNLAGGRVVDLNMIINKIEEKLGKKAILDHYGFQPGDMKRTDGDISKAKEELGYEPKTDLDIGLDNFIKWYNDTKRYIYD